MPKNRDLQSLIDIEQAAIKSTRFLQGTVDRKAFEEDEKTQSAIVFQLLIVGEATKRLSNGIRDKYPNVPWSLMAGMRDNLIHDYDDIDVDQVWKTVKRDIPSLLSSLQPIRKTLQQSKLQAEDESF